MAHPYFSQLRDLMNEVGLSDPDIICKHFFSGAAIYARGKMVASLSPKGLAFKLSKPRCDQVLSEGIAIPLCYFNKSPAKRGYVLFPDADQLNDDELRGYFNECVSTSAKDAA